LETGYAVWSELLKHEAEPYPTSDWPTEAARWIDDEFRAAYGGADNRFVSRYVLAIQYLPPPTVYSKIQALFLVNAQHEEANYGHILNRFLETTDAWLTALTKSFQTLRVMGDDEVFTYLSATVGEDYRERRLPGFASALDYLCTTVNIVPGLEPRIGERHLRAVSIRAFPAESMAAMLAGLDHLSMPLRVSARWIALSRGDAEKALQKIRTKWFSKRFSAKQYLTNSIDQADSPLQNPEAMLRTQEANDALADLAQARAAQGILTFTVIVTGKSRSEAEERAKAVVSAMDSAGFTAHVEKLNVFEAWLGTLPGNANNNVRQPVLSTMNMAHFAPFTSLWPGEATNGHLKGPALLYAKTGGSATFRLNLHVSDIGHTLIMGPTGAGKSYLVNVLISSFLKYPGARIVGIDKDGSSRATTLAMGGQFYDLSNPHVPGFQPLRDVHLKPVHDFALRWLRRICKAGLKREIDAKEIEALANGLTSLQEMPLDARTLTTLRALVQNNDLKTALAPFTGAGSQAYLFDRTGEAIQDHFWQVFEFGAIHGDRDLSPIVLDYIYHRMERLFADSRPTIFFLSEAWMHFQEEEEAKRVKQYLVTMRKFNVSMVFDTQSPDDLQRSVIGAAVFQSVATTILLPNPKILDLAVRPIYEQLGLNQRQMERLQEAAPKADYYLLSALGARLFSLPSGPITRVLCGTTDRAQHPLLDQIEASGSRQPFHHQLLAKKGVPLPKGAAA
jgi:type IV secretion system protein VirB4